MHILGEVHFIRPYGLLLLPLIAAVWWFWQRHSHPLRGWQNQMTPHLLNSLVVGNQAAQLRFGRLLLSVWLLAALAVAGPTWRLAASPFADDAAPMLILLKADESMSPPGQTPSQLERAQLKIVDLAAARKGQPLGLIAYAGSAHLVLPPTRDTTVVGTMAKEISPAIMPEPGDRLDLALAEAARVITQGVHGGTLLIIADSVNTDTTALRTWASKNGIAAQFLTLIPADSAGGRGVPEAARLLDAHIEPFDPAGNDINEIVRRAAQSPVMRPGDGDGRWQEAGYGLVPLIALLMLLSFRRTTTAREGTP